ncbi:swi5-dependent recombination DNA repair protein 1 homolog [Cyclopterus lumpus]|uniref:Swi5-dependent recombination DNA repair protein 1 homolog n=1 Tax=Cyclopterus lumpus TaxID=8103 RepID=A0A8C2Z7B9_CYCLU|nr:swi5-dependent recombination DNA repair protein 1 homolog [Cyclopterus lumpus]XP_034407918.1 swi5-dependent recombination DNA repair protein 1 homolog [Cyclopterus lumpus]XP_034407919.1 swi5-dependent recombination DNA repair protein 1 homolog [Cyclopterus lumpus]
MEVTPKADKSNSACYSPLRSAESSPCEYKEEKHHQKLSSSLKERLKRSRRSFTSPFSVAKRLCVDEKEGNGQQVSADSRETVNNPRRIVPNVDVNRNEEKLESERFPGPIPKPTHPPPSKDFTQQRDQLKKEVKDKMETLRRLKMVKMYRSKNDLTQLHTLIDKWRSCAQAALYELQSDVPVEGRKAGLSELIDLFGLHDGILHFDRTEDDFTT